MSAGRNLARDPSLRGRARWRGIAEALMFGVPRGAIIAVASMTCGTSGGDGTVRRAEKSGLRRAVNGIVRRGAAGPASASAVAEQTAADAGTPVSGSTDQATSRGCAQAAQRPSRPERASIATPGSRVVAPQSGQTIAIGKGPANIRGNERMTSPLRFRERPAFADRIPRIRPALAAFGGSAGCDARVDSFTVRQ
jgi:hypothetical protein